MTPLHKFPVDPTAVRENTQLSQRDFCDTYCLNLRTWQGWEQKRRVPKGSATILLLLIQQNPKLIARMLKEVRQDMAAATKIVTRIANIEKL